MIEALNRDCFCISLDRDALRRALDADPASAGLSTLIEARCPHLFASLPVFVSRRHMDEMARVVAAVEEVVALPAYRAEVLAHAPEIARIDPGARGAFIGYDFHLAAASGPQLIEINTNAGGALLNGLLGRAQRACCDEVAHLVSGPVPAERLEQAIFDMFLEEWRLAGREGVPSRIVIVDDSPDAQFLYPEFLLFERLFRRFGVRADVLAPEDLRYEGELRDARSRVDLVYNRLTDFSLEEPAHAAVRAAYIAGAAVLTPHPRAHALYADKRNLALLSDESELARLGVPAATIATLVAGVPRTRLVTAENADALWAERRRLFFKPVGGYGSRGAYRGDKLTRRVWGDIRQGGYVAQDLVAPSERGVGPQQALKVDVRNYVYAGEVQLLAARLYQGQTTNLRTPGGGFAPVLTTGGEGMEAKVGFEPTWTAMQAVASPHSATSPLRDGFCGTRG